MPNKRKSPRYDCVSAPGLARSKNGAIAFALAPLLALIFTAASPGPALGQCRDRVPEHVASPAPRPASLTLDDDGLPPLPVFALASAPQRHDLAALPKLQVLLAAIRPEPDRPTPALMREPIVGIASTYNPCCPGSAAEDAKTASGETYDPGAWTAAIQVGLRHRFGGVRYGTSYRPAYALVEGAGKRLIVKVNDVGPLLPGRVIDLNERAMRYFDPTLTLGLVANVRITPLDGRHWRAGPVEDDDGAFTALPDAPQPAARAQLAVNLN